MSAVAARASSRIDCRLEAWARWRRQAVRPSTGGFYNPLAALVAEGASVERGSRNSKSAEDIAGSVRMTLDARIAAAAADLARLVGVKAPAAEASRAELADYIRRLKQARRDVPVKVDHKAWASLIKGGGMWPEPDCPEEEEVESAVMSLPEHIRRVVCAEYLRYGTQDMKARDLRTSLSTYKRRLSDGFQMLANVLTR